MAVDFEKLMMNPIFAMGAGLFGGGPNAMMNAYQLVQGNARAKREALEHEEMMTHRRAMTENEREKNRLYGLQVEETRRNRDLESAQAAQSNTLTRAFMKQLGFDVPDDTPQPNAPTPMGMPAATDTETASPGFENMDAFASPVTPQTQLIPQSVDAPRPQPMSFTGSPEKVSQQHAAKLSPQSQAKLLAALVERDPTKKLTGISAALASEEQLRRQGEQDKRAEAAAARAEANQGRAEAAAMRSQQHLDMALARFQQQLAGKPAAAPAPRAAGGGTAAAPKAGAAPKPGKPPTATELKRADAAAEKAEGKKSVLDMVKDLSTYYDDLEKGEGIVDPSRTGLKGTAKNVWAAAQASEPGQVVSGALGTKNQTARDKIEMTRPVLMLSIMQTLGITGRQLDSNRELELHLRTATDPKKSIPANREALRRIQEKFSSPEAIAKTREETLRAAEAAEKKGGGGLPQGWKVEKVK